MLFFSELNKVGDAHSAWGVWYCTRQALGQSLVSEILSPMALIEIRWNLLDRHPSHGAQFIDPAFDRTKVAIPHAVKVKFSEHANKAVAVPRILILHHLFTLYSVFEFYSESLLRFVYQVVDPVAPAALENRCNRILFFVVFAQRCVVLLYSQPPWSLSCFVRCR